MEEDEEDEPLFSDELLAGIFEESAMLPLFAAGLFRSVLVAEFVQWRRTLARRPSPKMESLTEIELTRLAAMTAAAEVAEQFPEPIRTKLLDAQDRLADELLASPGVDRDPVN